MHESCEGKHVILPPDSNPNSRQAGPKNHEKELEYVCCLTSIRGHCVIAPPREDFLVMTCKARKSSKSGTVEAHE